MKQKLSRITNYVNVKFQKFLPLILVVLIWWPDVGRGQCTNDPNCVQLITSNNLELDPTVAPNPMSPPSNGFQTFQLGYVAGWHSSHNTPHHFNYLPGVLCDNSWTSWNNVIPCIGANRFQNEGIYTDLPLTEDSYVSYCLNLNVQKMNCGDDQNLDFIVSLTSGLVPFPPNTPIMPDPANSEQILRTEFLNDYSVRSVSQNFQVTPGSGYNQLWLQTKYRGIIGPQYLGGVATANSISLTCRTTALTGITANVNCGTVKFETVNGSSMSTFVSFEWDFGDPSSGTANTSTHATPTHIYTQNSTYNVCVDVIDNNGCCADRRCTSVTITDLPNFNIQSIASSPCNYEFQAVGIQNNQTGVTYSWNFGDGTPTGSGKFVNHTYTSSGTYTVSCTVTNICGSSTQSVIVVVNVTTINAEFSVQNNCPFYTFTVTNPVSNVTYTWDFGDNTANVTGNQVSHNYSFNGTKVVTLTATKNCGYGSMTQNVEVNCNAASCTDDPNVIVIGQTDQTTYISALFNNGTIPFTLTGQIRKISNLNFNLKGNLIIDRNVKFVECNWIMESGAQIVLNNTLDLDKNKLISCNNMWKGIIVNNNFLRIRNKCEIRDAENAIILSKSSNIDIRESSFIDNYRGIYAPGVERKIIKIYSPGFFIMDNDFKFESSSLKPPYTGQIDYEQSARSGVELVGVSTFNIKNGTYQNLKFGVHTTDSGILVSGAEFVDLGMNNIDGPTQRTGIYIDRGRATNTIRDICKFTNLKWGIQVVNNNSGKVLIYSNIFEYDRPDDATTCNHFSRCSNSEIIISNKNKFNISAGTGISVFLSQPKELVIDDNDFSSNGTKVKTISLSSLTNNSNRIHNNRFYFSGALSDDNSVSLTNVNHLEFKKNIVNNNSNIVHSKPFLKAFNCKYSVFKNNEIHGFANGMVISSSADNGYCCNIIDQEGGTENEPSFYIIGDSPSNIVQNTFNTFTFNALTQGYMKPQIDNGNMWVGAGQSATLQNGDPLKATENKFAVNLAQAGSVPRINGVNQIFPPDLAIFWFVPGGQSSTCATNPYCDISNYKQPQSLIPYPPTVPTDKDCAKLLSLINKYKITDLKDEFMTWAYHNVSFGNYHFLKDWVSKYGVNYVEDCLRDPVPVDKEVDEWYEADIKYKLLSKVDPFMQLELDDLDLSIDQAAELIESIVISDTEGGTLEMENILASMEALSLRRSQIIEQHLALKVEKTTALLDEVNGLPLRFPFLSYLKYVWTVELRAELRGVESIAPQEWDQLRSIAKMCPLTAGEAVFRAASLLISHGEYIEVSYDACRTSRPRAKSELLPSDISISPNPSTGLIYLNGLQKERVYDVQVMDLTGKIILSSKLEAGSNVLEIGGIPYGMYLLRVEHDKEIMYTGKIILIK